MKTRNDEKLAILVGGGPAPGINSVIHSAAIEAINQDLDVIGIYDGFQHLMEGQPLTTPLTIDGVSRIHLDGGSILRTSRANPTKKPGDLERCARALAELEISYLVGIGGDDTAFSVSKVAAYAQRNLGMQIRAAHVPKTIDNDLPLPEGIQTFGFETARQVGANLVMNLMEDSRTTQNWFLVEVMGRKAGHLALAIGKSSGATLTVIPEEWGDKRIRLQEVVDIVATAILLRRAEDRHHGVALLAEGITEQLEEEDLVQRFPSLPRDEHDHLRLSELNLAALIKQEVEKDLKELGAPVRVIDRRLGYELRCAPPCAYDIDYTRSLGLAAVDFLLAGGNNAIITLQNNQVVPIPFREIMDPETGKTAVRKVNIESFTYGSALKFMLRLKPDYAADDQLLSKVVAQSHLPFDRFKARYGYLLGIAERPF